MLSLKCVPAGVRPSQVGRVFNGACFQTTRLDVRKCDILAQNNKSSNQMAYTCRVVSKLKR